MEGSADAYRQLYERYAGAMYNTALRITGSTADAEDIIQEAFTDAYLQLSSYEHRASFGAWLKKITIYKSIALLRKKKIRTEELEKEDPIDNEEENEAIWAELTVSDVQLCMAKLPDGYRAILSLHLLEGYSYDDISTMLEISAVTVRTQYLRGRKKLAALLLERKYNKIGHQ